MIVSIGDLQPQPWRQYSNNLNKEIENRGFKVGDRVIFEYGDDSDKVWTVCYIYPNPDDLDASEALEPGHGLSTGALRYDIASYEGDVSNFTVISVDHNDVSFFRGATGDSLKFVEEVCNGYF